MFFLFLFVVVVFLILFVFFCFVFLIGALRTKRHSDFYWSNDQKDNKKKTYKNKPKMSRDMSFPTMWYVRPAKAKTSLRIRAV